MRKFIYRIIYFTFHVFDQGKALLIVEDDFDSAINGNLHEREEKGIYIITKIHMKYNN
jgi:hypothetical protein